MADEVLLGSYWSIAQILSYTFLKQGFGQMVFLIVKVKTFQNESNIVLEQNTDLHLGLLTWFTCPGGP